MAWSEFVAWYDGRRSYPANDSRMLALDRELIRLVAAGPDNWRANAARATELVRQYDS